MSTRATPSGINKDIQRKLQAKYSVDDEKAVRDWIEAVIGEPLSHRTPGAKEFEECLKDGVVLCQLMNCLRPECIKKINKMNQPFKKMENIGKFLKAAEEYGVKKEALFQTVDLYEGMNMGSVVQCLFALGGCAKKNGFHIPFGIAETDANKRNFSEEIMAAGKNVIGQQAGYTKGASQAGSGGFGNTRKL